MGDFVRHHCVHLRDYIQDLNHIFRQLGQGGFGVVRLVHLVNEPENKFAMKQFMRCIGQDRDALSKEIDLLTKLDHENVIRAECSFSEGDDLYIIMELADQGDLHQRIRKQRPTGSFPKLTIINWFTQILTGMAYIHMMRILHRDMKPSNILIASGPDNQEIMKICDFGLSKESEYTCQFTSANLGTAVYKSPEVLKAGQRYSKDADIWALGCIPFEIW